MGRYINLDAVLISMSNSNSNYQNLIFENFRGLDKNWKKKLCHSIYCSCRTQEHLPSVPRSPMTMLILLCPVQYNNSLFVHSGTVSGHACFWSECFRTYRTLKGWRAERFASTFSTSPFNSTILAGQNASSQLSRWRQDCSSSKYKYEINNWYSFDFD